MSTTGSMVDFMFLFHYFHPFPISMGRVYFLTPIEPGLMHMTYSSLPLTWSSVT